MSSTTDKYTQILKEYWGYPDFRGIQRDIIESICAGKDTLGLMPTGGGKSITFQVPALAMKGVCLVITPLISLMKDQVDHLRKKGIKAYAIYGSMQRSEIVKVLDNAVFGGVTLLYISPERLSSELFLTKLKHIQVSLITVDEAHCISQWGYDFRPSYLTISQIRKLKPQAPILALTATATEATIEDIQKQLNFNGRNVFRMSFERKNLAYIVRKTSDKIEEMKHILNSVDGCAIVYTHNRQKTKDIAKLLTESGISATFYHAGLDHNTREERQTMWQEDKTRVMVATNAFGMGIDKPDVRLVIHIDCPDSIEEYFQEAGRAGRDGNKSYAVLLRSDNDMDITILKNRIGSTFPDKDYIKQVYEHLAYFFQLATGSGYGHTFEFNTEKFCTYFKHHPIRMQSALKILEMSGYIQYSENDDNKARMRFLVNRDDLYRLRELSDEENKTIIASLRLYSGLFTDYVFIDEKAIAMFAGLDERETYEILKRLTKKHIIQFIPQKDIPRIKYLRDREQTEHIKIPQNVYEQRKALFKQRIEYMIRYLQNDGICRSRQLLGYFGETKTSNCNQCDVCITNRRKTPEKDTFTRIKAQIKNILSDGTPHEITELNDIKEDRNEIKATLGRMAFDEEIINDNGKIYLNKQ